MSRLTNKVRQLFNSKLVQNGIWLFLLQGFNTILPILTIPYITRILSPDTYGEFSISLNWVGYLQVIVEYGFTLSATRKLAVEKNKTEENALYSRVLLSRIALSILCAFLLVIIVIAAPLTDVAKVCFALLFIMVVGTAFQHNWFFQGKEDMKFITISNVISRSISTLLIFVLVKSKEDIYLYCLLYSFNFIIVGIVGFLLARYKYSIKLQKCKIKELIRELKDGWHIFMSQATTKIFAGFGVTFLSFFVAPDLIGIYSAIYKIPHVLILLWTPISQLLYPYISRSFANGWKTGINLAKKFFVPILIFFLLIVTVIGVANKPIVMIVFGSEYVDFSTILIPMIAWVIFGIINNLLGIQILVGSGHSNEYSKAFLESTVLFVLLNIVLGYFFTIYGISYAMMISEAVLSVLLLYKVIKIHNQ